MTSHPDSVEEQQEPEGEKHTRRLAEELEDGSLDPDELDREPAWWDEGSDDKT